MIFSLMTISNLADLFNQNDSSDMETDFTTAVTNILADSTVQTFIGEWEVVWGPFVKDSFVGNALNAMYIAKNTNDEYVVAIAGTDGPSYFEWLLEDFNILTTRAWPFGKATNPGRIPAGAHLALNELLELGPTSNNFLTFLQSVNPTKVYVTGHSLGGTLAPLVSLAIANTIDDVEIRCYRFAGLTPGDGTFVDYYNSISNITTFNIWNANDQAHNCFDVELMSNIKTLYDVPPVNIPWDTSFDPEYDLMFGLAFIHDLTQLPDSSEFSPFTYPLYPADTVVKQPVNGPDVDPGTYLGQATSQHVPAYAYGMRVVDGFLTQATTVLNTGWNNILNSTYFTDGFPDLL